MPVCVLSWKQYWKWNWILFDMPNSKNQQRQSKITSTQMAPDKQPQNEKSQIQSINLQHSKLYCITQLDEITFENVSKKNMQMRQFLYANTSTIIVTSIKSKELKSATSLIKFIRLKNNNALSRKQLAHNFNDDNNVQIEQDCKQRIVSQPRYCNFKSNAAFTYLL
ncbi:hypothetical protein RFI_26809 [Reticulomyxa filosa]|uniref:Uncharacterized protein n=1 Tax=Reticulomyxa filosa TaxID=46433 RepID=X6M989_RETFI|nr:hypothetical protein RFI_26809 [Reticulomyxa filosa]|eukprot:ETO10568.1 hypothetical protein RFI_26809 [Reticulomyxa filosa]